MNNMQLYLTIGIPTLTVILAWVSSRADINRLNDKLDRMGETLHTKIDNQGTSIRSELVGQGSSLRSEILAMRTDHHRDHLALMELMIPLHERMARLENR